VGELIAKKCLEKGIQKVVLTEADIFTTARIKALAEAARTSGLGF